MKTKVTKVKRDDYSERRLKLHVNNRGRGGGDRALAGVVPASPGVIDGGHGYHTVSGRQIHRDPPCRYSEVSNHFFVYYMRGDPLPSFHQHRSVDNAQLVFNSIAVANSYQP